ncbi:hypothetical protein C6I21_08095 [Alkalicoccus urumqiensis]|uniref:Transposase IS204/IS1001/IS1096/IS1165 zinc-finger domain-containing protein n=1 Tax=Alkalicoccus urumqiensis TaxID=1548213 RepID=A0A2P6MHX6_ALKUR|nr:hypothetical protein C6I21_08095 [Alkalicoccus urumqiensis]
MRIMTILSVPLHEHLHVLHKLETPDSFVFVVAQETRASACPLCQRSSPKKHSSYMRVIHDLPIQGKPVLLYLRTQKWFFVSIRNVPEGCLRNGMTGFCHRSDAPGGWRTCCAPLRFRPMVSRHRTSVRKSVWMSVMIRCCVYCIKQKSQKRAAPFVGMDDFAWKKGHRYELLIGDARTHQPMEMLPDREK